ncbi:MAG: hypothetical protein HY718_05650 [Planctomycetes bacterium]|nr:hypothetical protein [Planctomycetota bacterium]
MVTQTADGKMLFQFYRPGARQVVITGDFNGWQKSFHMARGRDGWWRAQVELAPGTYRFRYLADGDWYTDYAAFGLEPGPFGWNSVLKVDPAATEITAAKTAAAPATVEPQVRLPAAAGQPVDPRYPTAVGLAGEADEPPSPPRRVRRRPALAH